MPPLPFRVLLEDNHLLAIAKPAGLATMGTAPDRPSLCDLARQYIKDKYHKPGNVYLGVVSRLDAPVTGVIVLARTSKAARRLAEQFRRREVRKQYWALVPRAPRPDTGQLVHWLRKDDRLRRMATCQPHRAGAVEARLTYRTLRQLDNAVLLEIELETGRKHQIRVQLAAWGLPVLGDVKYGSRIPFQPGIALHAKQLQFEHPVRRTPVLLSAPVPRAWSRFRR
jgi:23S rRNA pseudouridine1911/1915/1917 synthase